MDSRFYPSAYVGDLEDLRTVNALKETIQRMETLLEVEPSVVVCDMHPKYNSTVVAEELGLPVLKVQHHYAHILSCMAENDWMEKYFWQILTDSGESEVLNHFYRLEATYQQKKDGVSQFL